MAYITVTSGEHSYPMEEALVKNLEKLRNKQKQDWDFKILVSGDGMTRTGKTTIGGQIARFFDPFATEKDNWCYDGTKLADMGLKLGNGRVLVYDEAKAGLDVKKVLYKASLSIMDYFNECGYLNQFMIIILPDFFDLNKGIALNLSIAMINVKLREGFNRGKFDFYSRKHKRLLYHLGKRKHNEYGAYPPSFSGNFANYRCFDHKILDQMKQKAIEDRKKVEVKDMTMNAMKLKKGAWKLKLEHHWKLREIAKLFETTDRTIINWIKNFKYEYEMLKK